MRKQPKKPPRTPKDVRPPPWPTTEAAYRAFLATLRALAEKHLGPVDNDTLVYCERQLERAAELYVHAERTRAGHIPTPANQAQRLSDAAAAFRQGAAILRDPAAQHDVFRSIIREGHNRPASPHGFVFNDFLAFLEFARVVADCTDSAAKARKAVGASKRRPRSADVLFAGDLCYLFERVRDDVPATTPPDYETLYGPPRGQRPKPLHDFCRFLHDALREIHPARYASATFDPIQPSVIKKGIRENHDAND